MSRSLVDAPFMGERLDFRVVFHSLLLLGSSKRGGASFRSESGQDFGPCVSKYIHKFMVI